MRRSARSHRSAGFAVPHPEGGRLLAAAAFAAALAFVPPARAEAACGNGVVEGTETCDDGNLAPGDGCSEGCAIEADWSCGCGAPTLAASGDTVAGQIGVNEGGPGAQAGCSTREVLAGVRFDVSDGLLAVTRATPFCGQVDVAADGTVSTAGTPKASFGGTGCDGWDPSSPTPDTLCPDGGAVVGVAAFLGGGGAGPAAFGSVSLVCDRLRLDGGRAGEPSEVAVQGTPWVEGGVPQQALCPEGMIGILLAPWVHCGLAGFDLHCAPVVARCEGQESICVRDGSKPVPDVPPDVAEEADVPPDAAEEADVPAGGRFVGGALSCASAPGVGQRGLPGALVAAGLVACALGRRRCRRRGARALVVAIAVLAPATGRAGGFDAERYRPAERARDGFALSTAETPGHLCWDLLLHIDYAHRPLGWEGPAGGAGTHRVVEHLLVGRLGASVTFIERLLLYGGLSFVAVQSEGDGATPAGVAAADGPGLGDAVLGLRGRIVSVAGGRFQLAAQTGLTFPLALAADAGQAYRGEAGVTIDPRLVGQADLGPARVLLNVGARLRTAARSGAGLGQELTLGAGAGVWLLSRRILLSGELVSGFAFGGGGGDGVSTAIEVLGGVKAFSRFGLAGGIGLGAGLARGPGTPDVRAIATIGWAPPCDEAPEPAPGPRAEPPKDRDGDGVPDASDRCPDERADRYGVAGKHGCPEPDADGDGIPVPRDACPTETEDRDGFADEDGCPEEGPLPAAPAFGRLADGEPAAPPSVVRIGCRQIRTDSGAPFASASAEILPATAADLDPVAEVLRANPGIRRVRVEGHTDSRGSAKADLDLSERRAKAVMEYLVARGVAAQRLESKGYGLTKPIATNKTEEGRARNRRVVFAILERDDACRDKGAPAACQEVRFAGRLGFAAGAADPSPASRETLDRVAELLRGTGFARRIELAGHTDTEAARDAGRKLSADRAEAVRAYLVRRGVPPALLVARGYGADRPVADNASPEGRARNRRVDFVVLEQAPACGPAK